MRLDPSLLDALAKEAENQGWELLVDSETPPQWDVEIEISAGSTTRIDRLRGHWRDTRDWHDHGSNQLDPRKTLRRVLRSLDRESNRVARGLAGRVSIGVEVLVGQALSALDAENSRLRDELAAARIEIEFLRTALRALNEAKGDWTQGHSSRRGRLRQRDLPVGGRRRRGRCHTRRRDS